MSRVTTMLQSLDDFQRRHPSAGFGYAVVKKFSDDKAGMLAAVLAYYAFVSVFPLLLVLVTVLNLVLHGDAHLRSEILASGLHDFPVIGPQLSSNVHGIGRSGVSLVIGLAGTFLGARGVANAAQYACNTVWSVPFDRRPGFPWNQVRSVGIVVVFGGGVLATQTLQTVVQGLHHGHSPLGAGVHVGAFVLAGVLNIAVFVGGLRLAIAGDIPLATLLPGAVIAALAWEVLELFGGYLITHDLAHAGALYGTFGLVLGLLSWLYLQARITLYALEVDVVRARRLWPRSMGADRLTEGDTRAYGYYLDAQRRRPE